MIEKFIPLIKKSLWFLLLLALIALAFFLVFYSLYYTAPIVLGFVLAIMIDPLVRFLTRITKMNRHLATLIVLVVTLATIGVLAAVLVAGILSEISNVYINLPEYMKSVSEGVNSLITKMQDFYTWLPQQVAESLASSLSNLSSELIPIVTDFFTKILTTAVSIPSFLIFFVVTLMSTYFISSDKDKIFDFMRKLITKRTANKISVVKTDMLSTFFGYLRAQLIIMSVIFAEIAISFTIIGIKQPLFFALIIALLDQVPYIGISTFVIPMAIINFINGNIRIGISLLIIYAIVWVVRQLIEPKIIGKQIGIHPLVTLLGLYVGLKVFGFIGLILGPVAITILKTVVYAFWGEKLGLTTPTEKPRPQPSS